MGSYIHAKLNENSICVSPYSVKHFNVVTTSEFSFC